MSSCATPARTAGQPQLRPRRPCALATSALTYGAPWMTVSVEGAATAPARTAHPAAPSASVSTRASMVPTHDACHAAALNATGSNVAACTLGAADATTSDAAQATTPPSARRRMRYLTDKLLSK